MKYLSLFTGIGGLYESGMSQVEIAQHYKVSQPFICRLMKKLGIKQGTKIRRLTPTECERLQGFPDGWTEFGEEFDRYGIDNVRIFRVERISDTQRYKTLGNAVTVNVIRDIMQRIL